MLIKTLTIIYELINRTSTGTINKNTEDWKLYYDITIIIY